MLGKLREPQGLRMTDELAQEAVPGRQRADGLPLFRRDAHGQELRQPGSLANNSQSPVLGIGHNNCGFDDPAQHLGQIEPSSHRHHGIQ
jgi:hypothetical protein